MIFLRRLILLYIKNSRIFTYFYFSKFISKFLQNKQLPWKTSQKFLNVSVLIPGRYFRNKFGNLFGNCVSVGLSVPPFKIMGFTFPRQAQPHPELVFHGKNSSHSYCIKAEHLFFFSKHFQGKWNPNGVKFNQTH